MICGIKGRVAAIVEDGFTLSTEGLPEAGKAKHPRAVKVETQIPGPRLSLTVGDQVSVTGGYGEDPGVFLSSQVVKFFPDGSTLNVHVNTVDSMFGSEEITPPSRPPNRPWWRFW